MTLIFKSRADDIETINRLLKDQTREFKKAWNEYYGVLTSAESLKIIRDFLEEGNEEAAIQYIEDQSSILLPVFLSVYSAAALVEIGLLSVSAIKNQKTFRRINSIIFDPLNSYTSSDIRYLQTNYQSLLNASQRKLFYSLISEANRQEMSVRKTARYIVENLGLTEAQHEAVLNYRRLLENGSRESLSRELRDKRFDRTVERSIKNKSPLTQDQINRMVEAYKRKFITYRTNEMIFNTTKTIVEAGRTEGTRQTLAQVGLQPGDSVKAWRSQRDRKVRFTHSHASLDGQEVREDEYFTSVSGARLRYPHDSQAPLSETMGCRCFLLRYIKPRE